MATDSHFCAFSTRKKKRVLHIFIFKNEISFLNIFFRGRKYVKQSFFSLRKFRVVFFEYIF